jgi:hypothetical protein
MALWLPPQSVLAHGAREPRFLSPKIKPARIRGVNWIHPAAHGLAYVNVLQNPGGNPDLVGRFGFDSAVGTVATRGDAFGPHARFAGTGGLRVWNGTGNTYNMLGSPAAASLLVVASADNTANRTTILGDWTSDGNGNFLICEFTGFGQPSKSLSACFGNPNNGYVQAALDTINHQVYCAGFTLSNAATGGVMRSWVDGLAGGTLNWNGFVASTTGDSQYPAIGQAGAFTGLRATANVYLVMIWAVRVPDAVMLDLTRNPYALLAANDDPYLISVASAAAPGVPTSLLNQNLAATSFRSAWTAPA